MKGPSMMIIRYYLITTVMLVSFTKAAICANDYSHEKPSHQELLNNLGCIVFDMGRQNYRIELLEKPYIENKNHLYMHIRVAIDIDKYIEYRNEINKILKLCSSENVIIDKYPIELRGRESNNVDRSWAIAHDNQYFNGDFIFTINERWKDMYKRRPPVKQQYGILIFCEDLRQIENFNNQDRMVNAKWSSYHLDKETFVEFDKNLFLSRLNISFVDANGKCFANYYNYDIITFKRTVGKTNLLLLSPCLSKISQLATSIFTPGESEMEFIIDIALDAEQLEEMHSIDIFTEPYIVRQNSVEDNTIEYNGYYILRDNNDQQSSPFIVRMDK